MKCCRPEALTIVFLKGLCMKYTEYIIRRYCSRLFISRSFVFFWRFFFRLVCPVTTQRRDLLIRPFQPKGGATGHGWLRCNEVAVV